MKRLIILVLGFWLLAGCSAPPVPPDQVVNEYFRNEYFKLFGSSQVKNSSEFVVEGQETDLVRIDTSFLDSTLEDIIKREIRFEVNGFEQDGKRAIVDVIITKPDIHEAFLQFSDKNHIKGVSKITHEARVVLHLADNEWKIYGWELDILQERIDLLKEYYGRGIVIKKSLLRVEANPDKGFYWPYYLSIPLMTVWEKDKTFILVTGNASPHQSDDFIVHDTRAEIQAEQTIERYGSLLKTPVLVPAYPRYETGKYNCPDWFCPQRLKKKTIIRGEGKYYQFDLQLLAMIEDAKQKLEDMGMIVHEKILMEGSSNPGAFVGRMLLLHPEKIHAATFGGESSPSVPVSSWNGTYIPYPTGIGGLKEITGKEFNLEEFKKVPIFIYRGGRDYSDFYEFSRPSYIFKVFGSDPVKRMLVVEEIYNSVGANVEVKIYDGVEHKIGLGMERDILEFFRKHMEVD